MLFKPFFYLSCFLLFLTKSQFCKPYCGLTCVTGYSVCDSSCDTPFAFDSGTGSGCTLDSTLYTLTTEQLPSQTAFSPSGYSSNTAVASYSCVNGADTYYMAGPFVVNNYIFKTFSGLGTNHYAIDIFWSYGIFGTWTSQPLEFIFTDSVSGIVILQLNQGQTCGSPVSMTGCSGSTGCFMDKQQTISHFSDGLSVNFSSMGSTISSSVTIQSWSLKDLVIVLSICSSLCATCTGPSAAQCLSCPSGLFLKGSICIPMCPLYTMSDTRVCVAACPINYYTNTYNSYCEPCPEGCSACSSFSACLEWTTEEEKNIVIQYLPLWIVIGIAVVITLGVLLWKGCCGYKTFENAMEEDVIDHRSRQSKKSINHNHSTEHMEARWLQDIDDLRMTKAKTGMGIQGIGRKLSSIG